jgi:cytochrome c-type biogenesis protein CcmH
MAIWVVFALMTGAAVLAVLWPLSHRQGLVACLADETLFYRAQLAEIERDAARGLIGDNEAAAARAEAGRRLLRASSPGYVVSEVECEPALRRRRAASAIAISTIPLVALALYGVLGSPSLPARPLAERRSVDPERLDLTAAVARVEAHLAQHPDDGRGWEIVAPIYLRNGRPADAAKAYAAALRLNGETAARLSDYGEALTAAAGGIVEAEARVAFERARLQDATSAKARFYLALAAEQEGNIAAALAGLKDLMASAPAGAAWLPAIAERIGRLEDAGSPAAAVADLPPDERLATIRGMVDGLAARLAADGSDAEGWLRLVRSFAVLGEPGKARAAVAAARKALDGRAEELAKLDRLAQELKLDEAKLDVQRQAEPKRDGREAAP